MFKNLKENDTIHIIEVGVSGVPKYFTGTLKSLSAERLPTNNITTARVVDIVVEINGVDSKIENLDPTLAAVQAGGYKIGSSKDWAMGEIRSMLDNARGHLAKVDQYKAIEGECADILSVNGISLVSDGERITKVENSINEVATVVNDIKGAMGDIMAEIKSLKDAKVQNNNRSNSTPKGAQGGSQQSQ